MVAIVGQTPNQSAFMQVFNFSNLISNDTNYLEFNSIT